MSNEWDVWQTLLLFDFAAIELSRHTLKQLSRIWPFVTNMLSRRGRQTMKPPTPTPPCSAPTPATAPPTFKQLSPPAASLVQSSGAAHACSPPSPSLAASPAHTLLSPLDLPLTVAPTAATAPPPQSVPHPRFYVLILLFLYSFLLLLLWLLTSERFIYSFVAQLKLRMYVRVCVCACRVVVSA